MQSTAVDPDGWRVQGRRKNTRRWCRGKVGREHKPETVLDTRYGMVCRPAAEWWVQLHNGKSAWRCCHQVRCSTCGKILQYFLSPDECPDYAASAAAEAASRSAV